ncbi:hypothetical protein TRVL_04545 [Trypanosoma vivax]|nr:hypothetical protein TRVL_04545 [Trypanosoma vivax]
MLAMLHALMSAVTHPLLAVSSVIILWKVIQQDFALYRTSESTGPIQNNKKTSNRKKKGSFAVPSSGHILQTRGYGVYEGTEGRNTAIEYCPPGKENYKAAASGQVHVEGTGRIRWAIKTVHSTQAAGNTMHLVSSK